MSKKDIDKLKEFIKEKKAKGIESTYLQPDKKVGSGRVEKGNKNKGNGPSKTKI